MSVAPKFSTQADGLAVIVPAHNAAATLPACLAALARSDRRPDEIIVFDDGSTDNTIEIAHAAGARVISHGGRAQGPAVGRNAGADATLARTLVFVDADVVVAREAIGRLEAPIVAGDAVATFGSYDDRPRSTRVAALYANLRHHWVHQQGREAAFTFFSGLGAMDRATFLHYGGFDPRYREPSIEDIDLGIRIVETGGRIRLVKDAQGSHRKDWGLRQLWRTDIFRRAIPWARLMKAGRGTANDLNVSVGERLTAIIAHLVWIGALITAVNSALWPVPMLAAAIYLGLNVRFFSFLFRSGGPAAGVAGIGLHWCYHLYASATYALVQLLSSPPEPARSRSQVADTMSGSTQATRP